jgi:hypothetical protein
MAKLLDLFEQAYQTLLIQEDRAQYIVTNQGDKLADAAMTQERKKMSAEDIVKTLRDADPTPNKQYLQWLANRYIAKEFRLEDISRIHDDLVKFKKLSVKMDNRDISTFKTLNDLYDAIEKHDDGQEVVSKGAAERDVKMKGAEKLIDTPELQVVKLLNKEAACFYGKGTKWCTAADKNNMFDDYKSQGDLYVLMVNKGGKQRKFQLSVEGDQFMDERDNELNENDIKLLSSIPAYTEFLNSLIKKHYNFDVKDEPAAPAAKA